MLLGAMKQATKWLLIRYTIKPPSMFIRAKIVNGEAWSLSKDKEGNYVVRKNAEVLYRGLSNLEALAVYKGVKIKK